MEDLVTHKAGSSVESYASVYELPIHRLCCLLSRFFVQDYMERALTPVDPENRWANLSRSAKKSVAAGVAGAALTNPLDVLRNEMFKTDLSVGRALAKLHCEEGAAFAFRGMNKNLVAVAIPIAVTIFVTDFLVRVTESHNRRRSKK